MAEKKPQGNDLVSLAQRGSVILSFVITVSGLIGNYYVNSYKISESQAKIEKLEDRVSKVERVNYDLLVEQLKQIEATNRITDTKITSTNQRIDEILKVLINSK